MVRCMVLLTNNPALSPCHQGLDVLLIDGTAHDVTVAARDRVHQGWKLLNHPLYGNFRPYHQPFRSLLLASPRNIGENGVPVPDMDSVTFLEQALAVYRSCADRWATPTNVPQNMYCDCSFIDCELMRATLETSL